MIKYIKDSIFNSLDPLYEAYGELETTSQWDPAKGELVHIRPVKPKRVTEGELSWEMIFNDAEMHVATRLNGEVLDVLNASLIQGNYWPIEWIASNKAGEHLHKAHEVGEMFAFSFEENKLPPSAMELN